MSNKVIKRYFVKLPFVLVSPLCISSGDTTLTDNDLIRDFDKVPFMPGTSIKGAIKKYCDRKDVDIYQIFGGCEGEETKLSSLTVKEVFFEGELISSIRDMVELDDDKQAVKEHKFDMEVIEAGKGELSFVYTLRETSRLNEIDLKFLLNYVILGINQGDICFGMKKNSGYGRIHIKEIKYFVFDKDSLDEFFEFRKTGKVNWKNKKIDDLNKVAEEDKYKEAFNRDTKDIWVIPLNIKNGMSIRVYSTENKKADFHHIRTNGKPVVTGTTWGGALKHQMEKILLDLGFNKDKVKEAIKEIFGYVDKNKKMARSSYIKRTESIIEGGFDLQITRTKINRFTGGSANKALFTEITHIGGKTKLELRWEHTAEPWMKELAALAILDMVNGYLSVGGETSIGRGIFELDSSSDINNNKKPLENLPKEYSKLHTYVKGALNEIK